MRLGELLEQLNLFFEKAINGGSEFLISPLSNLFDVMLQPVV